MMVPPPAGRPGDAARGSGGCASSTGAPPAPSGAKAGHDDARAFLMTLARVLEPDEQAKASARALMSAHGAAPTQKRDLERLLAACGRALALDPSSAVALARRSWARNAQRQGALALADAKLALTVLRSGDGPLAARIHANAGLAHLQLGDWAAAEASYGAARAAGGAATAALASKMIARARELSAADILAKTAKVAGAAKAAGAAIRRKIASKVKKITGAKSNKTGAKGNKSLASNRDSKTVN